MRQDNKFLILLAVFCLAIITQNCVILRVGATRTWLVDRNGQADFSSIQEAVNAADNGDSIEVMPGTFYEHVVVNKSVSLVGQEGTFIDGTGSGTVVNIEADFVYLGGFTVQNSGSGGGGIMINQSRGCVVETNNVVENVYGILVNVSENNTLRENTVSSNVWGIQLQGSRNNTIVNNSVVGSNRIGLYLDYSDSNAVNGNTLIGNTEGIYLESASANYLRNNNLTGNTYSFGVFGSDLPHFMQDVDTSNKVDDKPIYYYVNEHDREIPDDAGYIAIVNSTRMALKNFNLTAQQEGPLFAYTTDSTVKNMSISQARYGLRLFSCSNISVEQNTFDSNYKNLRLDHSWNNTISQNMIISGHEGIFLDNSNMNLISGNTLVDNINGMFIYYSSNNMMYTNNFIENVKHVFIAPAKILILNAWDDGEEGNYWSGFVSVDYDEDGVSESQYVLDQTNTDRCPLIAEVSVFDVLTAQHEHISVVCNSSISDFEFGSASGLISFNVSGVDGSVGFCRLVLSRRVLNGSYEVLVDGLPPLSLKEIVSSKTDRLVLYFTYLHSTHRVNIVPEHHLWVLLLSALASLAAVFSLRMKIRHRRVKGGS